MAFSKMHLCRRTITLFVVLTLCLGSVTALLPLRLRGSQLLKSNGQRVNLKGVNYFGKPFSFTPDLNKVCFAIDICRLADYLGWRKMNTPALVSEASIKVAKLTATAIRCMRVFRLALFQDGSFCSARVWK
jgi:hypothetical protein